MLIVILLQQVAQDAINDLIDIGFLVAQVMVVHLLEQRAAEIDRAGICRLLDAGGEVDAVAD